MALTARRTEIRDIIKKEKRQNKEKKIKIQKRIIIKQRYAFAFLCLERFSTYGQETSKSN